MFSFLPFDPKKHVRIYFTTLPHWCQRGCTYFVTYRLADSIPKSVFERWECEKISWLEKRKVPVENGDWKTGFNYLNGREKRVFQQEFSRQIEGLLDEGRGACALASQICAEMVATAWKYFDGRRYVLHDLVVMPNHVHVMITPLGDWELENILLGQKRFSAKEINKIVGSSGAVWQKHSFDHIVRNVRSFDRYSKYIESNPAKAGLRKGEYIHYSREGVSK